jgi:hypothetical protein
VRNTTENTAFKLTGNVLKSVNQKMHVGELFRELAKDFDCVYQEILLNYIFVHSRNSSKLVQILSKIYKIKN